jgi:hypothetical protein
MTDRRRADLVVALSGAAKIQSNFDTPSPEATFDTAWAVTSDSYPALSQELDRILDCSQQDLIAKEVVRRLVRFDFDYDSDAQLMAANLAYIMGVAAAPTGTPANEVQTITSTATGGTGRVGVVVGSVTKYTPQLAFNVPAADMKTALENINFIGKGNVTVALALGVYTFTFTNNHANDNIAALVVDGNGTTLTGGTWTQATVTEGAQRDAHITRISGFQPPAYGMAVGFRNSNKRMRLFKSGVADTMRVTGAHNQPRINVNWGMVASAEVSNVSNAYSVPNCQIYRPSRFRDTSLVIDGVDYALNNTLRDFEVSLSNGLIVDDDAYTAQDEDIHRAERADQRVMTINAGILGEHNDVIYDLAASLGEVPVSLRVGRSGNGILFNLPKGSVSLRNPELAYDGTAKRSKIQIQIEPELVPGDSTTPFTVDALVGISSTLLTVA